MNFDFDFDYGLVHETTRTAWVRESTMLELESLLI